MVGRWTTGDATLHLCRHPTPVQRSHGKGLVSLAAIARSTASRASHHTFRYESVLDCETDAETGYSATTLESRRQQDGTFATTGAGVDIPQLLHSLQEVD